MKLKFVTKAKASTSPTSVEQSPLALSTKPRENPVPSKSTTSQVQVNIQQLHLPSSSANQPNPAFSPSVVTTAAKTSPSPAPSPAATQAEPEKEVPPKSSRLPEEESLPFKPFEKPVSSSKSAFVSDALDDLLQGVNKNSQATSLITPTSIAAKAANLVYKVPSRQSHAVKTLAMALRRQKPVKVSSLQSDESMVYRPYSLMNRSVSLQYPNAYSHSSSLKKKKKKKKKKHKDEYDMLHKQKVKKGYVFGSGPDDLVKKLPKLPFSYYGHARPGPLFPRMEQVSVKTSDMQPKGFLQVRNALIQKEMRLKREAEDPPPGDVKKTRLEKLNELSRSLDSSSCDEAEEFEKSFNKPYVRDEKDVGSRNEENEYNSGSKVPQKCPDFCGLGCICESLNEHRTVQEMSTHCRKLDCMFDCTCKKTSSDGTTRNRRPPATSSDMLFYDESYKLWKIFPKSQQEVKKIRLLDFLPESEKNALLHSSARTREFVSDKSMDLKKFKREQNKDVDKENQQVSPKTLSVQNHSSSSLFRSRTSNASVPRPIILKHAKIAPTPSVGAKRELLCDTNQDGVQSKHHTSHKKEFISLSSQLTVRDNKPGSGKININMSKSKESEQSTCAGKKGIEMVTSKISTSKGGLDLACAVNNQSGTVTSQTPVSRTVAPQNTPLVSTFVPVAKQYYLGGALMNLVVLPNGHKILVPAKNFPAFLAMKGAGAHSAQQGPLVLSEAPSVIFAPKREAQKQNSGVSATSSKDCPPPAMLPIQRSSSFSSFQITSQGIKQVPASATPHNAILQGKLPCNVTLQGNQMFLTSTNPGKPVAKSNTPATVAHLKGTAPSVDTSNTLSACTTQQNPQILHENSECTRLNRTSTSVAQSAASLCTPALQSNPATVGQVRGTSTPTGTSSTLPASATLQDLKVLRGNSECAQSNRTSTSVTPGAGSLYTPVLQSKSGNQKNDKNPGQGSVSDQRQGSSSPIEILDADDDMDNDRKEVKNSSSGDSESAQGKTRTCFVPVSHSKTRKFTEVTINSSCDWERERGEVMKAIISLTGSYKTIKFTEFFEVEVMYKSERMMVVHISPNRKEKIKGKSKNLSYTESISQAKENSPGSGTDKSEFPTPNVGTNVKDVSRKEITPTQRMEVAADSLSNPAAAQSGRIHGTHSIIGHGSKNVEHTIANKGNLPSSDLVKLTSDDDIVILDEDIDPLEDENNVGDVAKEKNDRPPDSELTKDRESTKLPVTSVRTDDIGQRHVVRKTIDMNKKETCSNDSRKVSSSPLTQEVKTTMSREMHSYDSRKSLSSQLIVEVKRTTEEKVDSNDSKKLSSSLPAFNELSKIVNNTTTEDILLSPAKEDRAAKWINETESSREEHGVKQYSGVRGPWFTSGNASDGVKVVLQKNIAKNSKVRKRSRVLSKYALSELSRKMTSSSVSPTKSLQCNEVIESEDEEASFEDEKNSVSTSSPESLKDEDNPKEIEIIDSSDSSDTTRNIAQSDDYASKCTTDHENSKVKAARQNVTNSTCMETNQVNKDVQSQHLESVASVETNKRTTPDTSETPEDRTERPVAADEEDEDGTLGIEHFARFSEEDSLFPFPESDCEMDYADDPDYNSLAADDIIDDTGTQKSSTETKASVSDSPIPTDASQHSEKSQEILLAFAGQQGKEIDMVKQTDVAEGKVVNPQILATCPKIDSSKEASKGVTIGEEIVLESSSIRTGSNEREKDDKSYHLEQQKNSQSTPLEIQKHADEEREPDNQNSVQNGDESVISRSSADCSQTLNQQENVPPTVTESASGLAPAAETLSDAEDVIVDVVGTHEPQAVDSEMGNNADPEEDVDVEGMSDSDNPLSSSGGVLSLNDITSRLKQTIQDDWRKHEDDMIKAMRKRAKKEDRKRRKAQMIEALSGAPKNVKKPKPQHKTEKSKRKSPVKPAKQWNSPLYAETYTSLPEVQKTDRDSDVSIFRTVIKNS